MRAILKWIGIILGTLVVLLLVGAGAIYFASGRVINGRVTVADEQVVIPTDSLSTARGQHLARAIAKCVDCHGDNLAGATVIDVPVMGKWVSVNLTRGAGGVGGVLTDADWVRAIRHAIGHDGRKLLLMPSDAYTELSAEDIGAIIAWAKSVPPVDTQQPRPTYGPVARGLLAFGQAPLFMADVVDHSKAPPPAVAPGPTLEYGEYLAHAGGCASCHGSTFAGGKVEHGDPSWPPAANLTPTGLVAYTETTFISTLRTGVRPGGGALNPAMPWRLAGEMTDDEMHAVWLYLQSLPPREFGAR